MPELDGRLAYPAAVLVMVAVSAGLAAYFLGASIAHLADDDALTNLREVPDGGAFSDRGVG